jgi:hypothetical protein
VRWRARSIVQLHDTLRASRPQLKRDPLGRVQQVTRIRIVACPPGEAPESVRRAWIGLELPLPPGRLGQLRVFVVLGGVLSEPRTLWRHILDLVLGRFKLQAGYAVNAREAVNILADRDPLTAKWWREHCSHLLDGKRFFVFAANVCQAC